MNDHTIPPETRLAARRAFIRTTAQSYAAALPVGGLSVGTVAAYVDMPPSLLVVSILSWLAAPPIAGLTAYLSMVADGIPEDYQPGH